MDDLPYMQNHKISSDEASQTSLLESLYCFLFFFSFWEVKLKGMIDYR